MKAKNIIIAAVALLAFASAASAQKKIKDVFEDVTKYSGVSKDSEQKTSATDSSGVTSESRIITIKVRKEDFPSVIEKLQNAFDSESGKASMSYTYTRKVDKDAEGADSRMQWNVWREGATPVLVGAIKDRSFFVANFDDKRRPGYRTCYAAEWSDTDAPDMPMAKLIYVYGRKPEPATSKQPVSYYGSVTWPSNLPEIPQTSLLNDSLFIRLAKGDFAPQLNTGKPMDIPFNNNTKVWMSQAMNHVKHLSASDWHRFFGILTQNMMDRAKRESAEDLVVAAGLVLDLCKNADQLDAEERRISVKRLTDVAQHYFDSDKLQYVYDLLMHGARILEKE